MSKQKNMLEYALAKGLKLTDRQLELLDNPVLTLSELADLFGVHRNTAKKITEREKFTVEKNSADGRSSIVVMDTKVVDALARRRVASYHWTKIEGAAEPKRRYTRGNLAKS